MPADPFTIRRITLGEAADTAALRWGEREGWIIGDSRLTFAAMAELSRRVARAMLAHGIGKGDLVATWTPNLPEWIACELACGRIGAVLVPINTRFRSFELQHLLRHSRAKMLVLVDKFLGVDFAGILGGICPEIADMRGGRLESASLPNLRLVVSLSPSPRIGALPWSEFLDAADRLPAAELSRVQAGLRPDEPVLVQYTSGTTSLPKGALVDHTYVLNYGVELAMRMGVGPGEPWLNTQPCYHVGGSCAAAPIPLTLGGPVVMPEYYEPEAVLRLIERERCIARSGMGAMYVTELAHPRLRSYDLSSLRGGWCVGPPALMDRVRDEMNLPGLIQCYSPTEGGGTAGLQDDPWEKRRTSCGKPITGTEIAVVDPDTERHLSAGETGEIWCRGWLTMIGYLHQPEETRAVKHPDGWIRTGDLGRFDDQGYLHFAGRIKDMIRVGGENVSAAEVENLLLQHPAVKQAAVIGVPDPRLDEVVMAIIEVRAGSALTEDEVITYCRERVAGFRVPRHVRFTSEWPITGSGKVQKPELRARYIPGLAAPAEPLLAAMERL